MHRHCRGRLGKRVRSIGVWAVAWWWIVCSAGEIARSAVADDEHMHGAVEAMTPHQPHTGPHMKWTTLRPVGAGDPEQANRIVQTLRQALSKYKTITWRWTRGSSQCTPSASRGIIILPIKSAAIWLAYSSTRPNPPHCSIKKPAMGMNLKGRCLRRRGG